MTETIKVHVLNFWSVIGSHSEIILEAKNRRFYKINIGSYPKAFAQINDRSCLNSLENASEIKTIEIQGDLEQIIFEWNGRYREKNFNCFTNNCAHTVEWFLGRFAYIPESKCCDQPYTCNYLCCGLFAPSFLHCTAVPG